MNISLNCLIVAGIVLILRKIEQSVQQKQREKQIREQVWKHRKDSPDVFEMMKKYDPVLRKRWEKEQRQKEKM